MNSLDSLKMLCTIQSLNSYEQREIFNNSLIPLPRRVRIIIQCKAKLQTSVCKGCVFSSCIHHRPVPSFGESRGRAGC